MENEKYKQEPKSGEDDIHSQITDKQEKDSDAVNSFKSGDKKEPRTYDKPFDEQMYGSFAEIKKQKGEEETED